MNEGLSWFLTPCVWGGVGCESDPLKDEEESRRNQSARARTRAAAASIYWRKLLYITATFILETLQLETKMKVKIVWRAIKTKNLINIIYSIFSYNCNKNCKSINTNIVG